LRDQIGRVEDLPATRLEFLSEPVGFRHDGHNLFLFNRGLLRRLPLLAWECLKEVYGAILGSGDLVPGAIAGIQTFGALAHWHSLLHLTGTAGAFTPEGVFLPMPEKLETEPFRLLWEPKVTEFLFSPDGS